MTTANVPTVDAPGVPRAWARLATATGASGLLALVLIFVPIVALSSLGEPPLDATTADAAAFITAAADVGWVDPAEAVVGLGTIAFLWFVVGFSLLLRRAEGDPPWRSTIALVSGLLLTAYVLLDASWDAAVHRGDEIDPGLAAYAFDVGNIGFTNVWLAMASFAVCTGWVTLTTGAFPRWIGWCALVSGVGLVVARFLWTVEGVWFLPYGLFWVWVVAVCVRLLRRGAGPAAPAAR